MMTLSGKNFIGGKESGLGGCTIQAFERATGDARSPMFYEAVAAEVESACAAAADAFGGYSRKSGSEKATFLRAIASEIEVLGPQLIETAMAESGLPQARLEGERGRTCGQLRMFAGLVEEGSWVDARIDEALPERKPAPMPQLARMLMPIGPVAVFGASNFPLAFSVAGGDTASALAAGCPVVVKAHPAHPGTSELVARAILKAAEGCGMPDGVFSMVHGGAEVGRGLVTDGRIAAVGFTGSFAVGKALFDLAVARPVPIPFFGELGSINPVVVLPGALADSAAGWAEKYAGSLTLGVGQFCTNPGVVISVRGAEFDAFIAAVTEKLNTVSPGVMLTPAIAEHFHAGVSELGRLGAELLTAPEAGASFMKVSGAQFLGNSGLHREVFGPCGLAVECDDFAQVLAVIAGLEGQLTLTALHGPGDETALAAVLAPMARKAGRVLLNGFPTGVEVVASMQHGGPFPATTDSRSTSVGTAAIFRWVRPVCFQNVPDGLLPAELQAANPLEIRRIVNGTLS